MSTKQQRRRDNFGPPTPGKNGRNHNTVRSTSRRKFHNSAEHAPPKSGVNHAGERWAGWSRASMRKPFNKRQSWREWLREHPASKS